MTEPTYKHVEKLLKDIFSWGNFKLIKEYMREDFEQVYQVSATSETGEPIELLITVKDEAEFLIKEKIDGDWVYFDEFHAMFDGKRFKM